ncbi:hypothetical protein LMG28140_03296 [Paraburkholderia metrosideri]|uniref:Sulfonate ABC transporter permease n=1 Tax=Paraburkholderia metrosideri TaxID=580937 RepID=A0ABN7HUT2_9BURK|nr:hypothetical protein LMG28140_03296 [Paraburkholderia metrosideri]
MNVRFDLRHTANPSAKRLLPYGWDFVAVPLIICMIAMAAIGFDETLAPMSVFKTQAISLDPARLPEYAIRTTLRMLAAMVASLIFTLAYGTLAAKSRRAEKVRMPILDILQAVPVLGYIFFTVTFLQWGDTKVVAPGLGAYIAQTTATSNFPKIILGIAVMSLFVTLFNRTLARPMYAYANSRLRLD